MPMIDVQDPAKLAALHAAVGTAHDADPGALVAGASEALRRGAFADAERLLDAALVLDPELAPAWSLYGALSLARGRPEEARTAYEKAIGLDDTDPLTAVALAELYAEAAARDPRAKDRALAMVNFLFLEHAELPEDISQRAKAVKRNLKTAGARA